MSNDSPVQLVTFRNVHDYTKARGFDESDYEKTGWQPLPLAKAKEALGHTVFPGDSNAFALVFHYHYPDGTPMEYATIRIIRRSVVGFTPESSEPKLLAPGKKPPRVYFSKQVKWGELPTGAEVQIHESVLKAEAANKRGYIAIGISGVWGWSSRIHRIALLEDFSLLPWASRGLKPVVVFDSNTTRGYPEFQELLELAIQRLAGAFELEYRVPVRVRCIPPGPLGSWGYDDWCVAGGGKFEGLPLEIDTDQSRACLEKLNSEFSYDHILHRVVQIAPPHSIISVRDFKDKIKPLRYVDAEGDLKPASEAWLVWEKRRETHGPVYSPGRPQIVDRRINFWDGWGCESVRGDCTPFLDLLENCLENFEVKELLGWMAWHIQKPELKKSSKVPILVGPEGVGKSAIFRVLGVIHGAKNCSYINTGELEGSFNDYLANKTLVVVDDFTKMDGKTNAKLRNISTNETIRVNAKYTPPYEIQNTAALAFTGNEYDGVKMEEEARRYLVLQMREKETHIKDRIYWGSFWKWTESGGARHLRFFLEAYDASGFEPYSPAPMTSGKRVMAEASSSSLHSWLRDVKEHIGERSVVTTRELDFLYIRSGGGSQDTTAGRGKAIGDWLAAHGYQLATESKIKIEGITTRVWAIDKVAVGWPNALIHENIKKYPLFYGSKAE